VLIRQPDVDADTLAELWKAIEHGGSAGQLVALVVAWYAMKTALKAVDLLSRINEKLKVIVQTLDNADTTDHIDSVKDAIGELPLRLLRSRNN
jgi:hypothetical protein